MSGKIISRTGAPARFLQTTIWHKRGVRLAVRVALALLIGCLWFKTTRLAILVIDLNSKANALKQTALALPDSQDIPGSLKQLRSGIDDIHALVVDIRATVWPFEAPLKGLGWLPVVGPNIAAAPHLLQIADSLLTAVHSLDVAYSPLAEKALGSGHGSGSSLELLMGASQVDGGALADARANVDTALRARRQIADTATLHPKLQSVLDDVDKLLDALDKGVSAAQAAPDLLGVNRPQHVLVLIENADELRATGGFITASAYIVIDQGHLETPVVLSSNSPQLNRDDRFQYQVPPPPFFKYMHLQRWYFQDANWWADFPASATKAAELYSAGMDVPVDTVMAINQYTIRDLIGIVGPITLDDGAVITQDNAIESLQALWSQNLAENGPEGRKVFIKRLAPLLISKMLNSKDTQTLMKAWGAQKALSQRHDLLIYSTDARIQELSQRMGMDGSIPMGKSDYVYFLDTNVGWNKVDLILQREMAYHINLASLAQPSAQLDVTYRNPGPGRFSGPACISEKPTSPTYAGRADDCYADFIRLYLPDGAQLVTSPTLKFPDSYVGQPDQDAAHFIPFPGERDKEIFGALLVIAIRKQKSLSFTYTLPPQMIFDVTPSGDLVYNLTFQKQPGRQSFPVTIAVTLPQGIPISSITPKPTSQDGQTLAFQLSADADIHIRIALAVGASMIQQLGISPAAETLDQTPRVAPTNPPLPTALPATATPLPATATPLPATPTPLPTTPTPIP